MADHVIDDPLILPPCPLDPLALTRLRRLGGDRFLREMIELFLEHVPKRIEAACAGVRQGDLLAVERAGYSLNSSARNLGVTELRELAFEIERQAAQRNPDQVRALLHTFETAFLHAKSKLEALMKSLRD